MSENGEEPVNGQTDIHHMTALLVQQIKDKNEHWIWTTKATLGRLPIPHTVLSIVSYLYLT